MRNSCINSFLIPNLNMNPLQKRRLNGWIKVNPRIRSGRFWTVRFLRFLVIIFMQLWESCFDSSLFVNLATILWFFWKKDSVRVRVWKRTVQILYGFTLILYQKWGILKYLSAQNSNNVKRLKCPWGKNDSNWLRLTRWFCANFD